MMESLLQETLDEEKMSVTSSNSFLLDSSDISEIISCDEVDDDDVLFERPLSPRLLKKRNKITKKAATPVPTDKKVPPPLKDFGLLKIEKEQDIDRNLDVLFPATTPCPKDKEPLISPILFNNEIMQSESAKEDNVDINPARHDDVISLYAPIDEDCSSLYSNFTNSGIKTPQRSTNDTSTGIQFLKKRLSVQNPTRDKKIVNENIEDGQLKTKLCIQMIIAKIGSLLNHNNRESVVEAAEVFQTCYKNCRIIGVNGHLVNTLQRMTSLLLFFHEMKLLYRIARFVIDLKVTPPDRVLTGLIEHLGYQHEMQKIIVLVNRIKEQGLPVGSVVYTCADKYVSSADGNILLTKIQSDKISRRTINYMKSPIRMDMDQVNPGRNEMDGDRGLSTQITIQQESPDKSTQECDLIYINLLQAASATDWIKFGNLFSKLIFTMKPEYPIDERFTAICETMTKASRENGNITDLYMIFDIFLTSAIENYPHLDEDIIHFERSLTRVGIDVAMRVPSEITYEILRLMYRKGLSFVPEKSKQRTDEQEEFVRGRAALVLGEACLKSKNALMAYVIVHQYFVDHKTDIVSQSTGPALNSLLHSLIKWLLDNGTVEQATEVCGMLPHQFGTDRDKMLLCRVLRTVLRLRLKNDQDLHTSLRCIRLIVDQMLPRQMIWMLRRVIVATEFNTSLLACFKYLESKGLYSTPRILQYPHLVMMPAALYKEEMALIMYRHLNELAQFLTETGQNLRIGLPFRIVVCHLRSEEQNIVFSTKDKYIMGCSRLEYVLSNVLSPPLDIINTTTHKTKETMYNISMLSVKQWLRINGAYRDQTIFEKDEFRKPAILSRPKKRWNSNSFRKIVIRRNQPQFFPY